ncbi:MAG: MarR family transcriptional regulator [Thalassospira sp.]|nr:MarR family transcriptional regulator [Thalassospira sp.]|tara:strand:- start:296 stop:787 length:492 start_codon:yes stop_codon:yes gene_type:complete
METPLQANKKKKNDTDTGIAGLSPDSPLRGFVGYNLKRAYMSIHSDFVASLTHLDLKPTTYSALAIINENPDISQTDLARSLAMERSNIVVMVDELQARGLIVRNKVPTDRRVYALRTTAKGIELFLEASRAVQKHEDKLLEGFGPEERAHLVEMLIRIQQVK